MNLRKKVTTESFYTTLIEVMNGVLGLTEKEIEILKEFLEEYNKTGVNYFTTSQRKSICAKVNLEYNTFNNYLTKLRKKGVLAEGLLILVKKGTTQINFTLELEPPKDSSSATKNS